MVLQMTSYAHGWVVGGGRRANQAKGGKGTPGGGGGGGNSPGGGSQGPGGAGGGVGSGGSIVRGSSKFFWTFVAQQTTDGFRTNAEITLSGLIEAGDWLIGGFNIRDNQLGSPASAQGFVDGRQITRISEPNAYCSSVGQRTYSYFGELLASDAGKLFTNNINERDWSCCVQIWRPSYPLVANAVQGLTDWAACSGTWTRTVPFAAGSIAKHSIGVFAGGGFANQNVSYSSNSVNEKGQLTERHRSSSSMELRTWLADGVSGTTLANETASTSSSASSQTQTVARLDFDKA